MESIDEQGPELEAVGSRRTVTSTGRGTKETDNGGLSYETVMESDSDNLQPPTLEMLSNESANTGPQATESTCHKEPSQRSHDTSPTNDYAQGLRDATLLESSHAGVETATDKRHEDSETQHLKEDSQTHFQEYETSSDDTDEWETASEESVALDPEPHDPCSVKEDTGSYGHEDVGSVVLKTISEDAHGQETVIEDTGLHRHETASEDAGIRVYETVDEEAEPHCQEIINKDTGPYGLETVSKDAGHDGEERHSKDAGLPCQETRSEEAGPHGHERWSEDTESHGYDTVSKDAEAHSHGTVIEDAQPHGQEAVDEGAGPHGQETVGGEAGPRGQEAIGVEAEPHGQMAGPHGQEAVVGEAGPHDQEAVVGEAGPHDQVAVVGEAGPHDQEAVVGEAGPHGQEAVGVEAGPHGQEGVGVEAGPHSHMAGPHGQEAVGGEAWPHGQEAVGGEAWPHGQEAVGEEVDSHGQEAVGEEAGLHGQEEVGEEAGFHGQEEVGEEAGPHSQEAVGEEAEPHGQEAVGEETRPHGQEAVGEEARPHDQEAVGEEAEPHGQEAVGEEARPYGQEAVGEEAEPHGQEAVGEEAGPHGQEAVSEETVPFGLEVSSNEAEPLSHGDIETDNREATPYGQDTSDYTMSYVQEAECHRQEMDVAVSDLTRYNVETVSELVRAYCSNAELQYNETVSGESSAEFDEDRTISLYEDQPLNDIIPTVNEETPDDKKETLHTERPNEMSSSAEILESDRDDIISYSTCDDGVDKETSSDETHGGHFQMVCHTTHNACRERDADETQHVYIETVNEDIPVVCKETIHEETQVVHMKRDNEVKQDVYKGIDSQETSGERTVQETCDSEDTEVGNIDGSVVEIFGRIKEDLGEERIITEPSSEEREMEKRSNEGCERNYEFSEAPRVLDEGATSGDGGGYKEKWDLTEAPYEHVLTEDIAITYLECEQLEEKLHSISSALVGTGEELSEDLTNILNQEAVPELQYSTLVTTDEKSYMGCTVDTETQLDVSTPPLKEEKGQADYAKALSDIETESVDPEYIRSTDTQNEPYHNLGFSYKAEPEVQVVSSDSQGIGEPCLPLSGLLTEQSTHSRDELSIGLQYRRFGGPELHQEDSTVEVLDPHSSLCLSQVDQSTQDVPQDEPDHYKLDFFPITDIGVISEDRAELGPDHVDTECITRLETTQESFKELAHQESTLGDTHFVIDPDQEAMNLGSETTATNLENIKIIRRQRSNTDPCLIHDQEENVQASSNTEGSSRGRLRSLTPPCDKFTSSYTAASPKTMAQSTTSVLYPMPDDNKTSHRIEDSSSKQYKFYPTQIFNPMILLGHTQEESGFYQEETFTQGYMQNASQGPFQSPPKDGQVLLHTQNRESIIVGPTRSAEETSNTKPMLVPSVAPVWLPPHPTRYIGDSGEGNEIKSMKDNPLVRRATIRHKRSNVGGKPTAKRFSNSSLPAIPQKDYPVGLKTSNLPKIQPMNINKIQISSKNRHVPQQPKISEETSQSKSSSPMETVREEGHPAVREKPSNSPQSILLRGTRSKAKPPSSDPSQSIHRRYSTFINSSNLLYQEYSDVALNQEIQRQKPGDSPIEDTQPSSPRVRRRILSSQDSYLQRLSISSADSLWQDIPKIRDSVTFLSMTREEQKLQEAKFELIMSEALYLRSLNIAVDHFQRSAELQEVLSAQDRQWLFSRLSEVRDASADFLFDLEEEFESNMYNFQVCEVVISHEPTFRRVYLPYVTNQSYQDRTFQRLMNNNPRFQQVLAKLESDPVCQRLSLKSFLILPFQRITRLRLLLQNILKRSAPGSAEELQATAAHNALEKLIRDCNGSVQRMKDTEELILLNQKIQFECKIFPLISQSRRLVKHGEVTSLEFNSMSFKWKVTTRPIYLHLFNDCLLLSRVREGGRFVVFDHASDFRVERCEIKLHTNQKNIFRVFLRDSAAMGRESSQDVRETEYILRTEMQSQKLRWICALSPPKEEIDFWRDHGLSQVQCLKSYKARENDELSLEKADILMITQNSDDGWLHGIRLSDQQSGWFPQSNVQSISRNACLRNLQEEQRLQKVRAKLQPPGAKGQ